MTNSDPSSPGRRDALRALAAAALGAPAMGQAQSGEHRVKQLRYPFEVAETGFDPAQIIDLYSRIVAAHLFDALYGYDHLARPFKIRPNTAAAMPEISDNFRTYVIRLQPGIFFQDDAAFKGRARELVAQDYVYSLKRFFDPRWKSPAYASLADLGIIGMARPARLRTDTTIAMPEVSTDHRTFTFRIRPGIYFQDDPAFKGERRELVAADYVYSWKRIYDPRWKSPMLFVLENSKVVGLTELRAAALKGRRPFDYTTEVEGLRTLDRYTFRLRLAEPNPRMSSGSPRSFTTAFLMRRTGVSDSRPFLTLPGMNPTSAALTLSENCGACAARAKILRTSPMRYGVGSTI